MKIKILFKLLTVIAISSMSLVKAMETRHLESWHDSEKKHHHMDRKEIVNELLIDFESFCKRIKSDIKYDLDAISKYYNTGYNFGNESSNKQSLENWIVYTRSLYVLKNLGYEEYGLKLQDELDRARRRLKTIDFYCDDKDYGYCLSGIWSIVSIFDSKERESFLTAIETGEEIPKSPEIATIVKRKFFDYTH